MPYLAANAFNPILAFLEQRFPGVCNVITLPEASIEGRVIQGIRIGKPAASSKRTVLLFGGCHARELVNPDLLINFAAELLYAYDLNSDLHLGSGYPAATVQMIVNAIDILVVPLINPDGRAYVQSTYPMWRKNRNPNPGQPCAGVDINRNYDFLWSSGIGTSTNACQDVFRGSGPFSEPETRNVRWLLDNYPDTVGVVDVHSYSELVLYPWGDDETQVTDPTMNFMNPAFNGQRGTGGDAYKEYMNPGDRDFFVEVGYRVRDAIYAARGHCYTVKPSFNLYPTSGTSTDYAYSRHIVDATKRKVFSYCMETGLEFQPPAAEATEIMNEASAGLFIFCLGMCCPVLTGRRYTASCSAPISAVDLLRESRLMKTPPGRRYEKLLTNSFMEVRELMQQDKRVYSAVVRLIRYTEQIARLYFADPTGALDARLIANLDRALASLSRQTNISDKLKKEISAVRDDLPRFKGKTVDQGLKSVGRGKARKKPKPKG
jgi:murein tripeptide amidase MpaA